MTRHLAPVQSVLVATSTRPESDVPLALAGTIANETGAQVTITHCLPKTAFSSGPLGNGWIDEAAAASERPHRRRLVDDQAARCGLEPGSIREIEIDVEVPHRAVLAAARASGADLIVIGAPNGLGSIVDRIVRKSPLPVLIARDGAPTSIRSALFTTDLSVPSADAIALGRALLSQLGARPEQPLIFSLDRDHVRHDLRELDPEALEQIARDELSDFLERHRATALGPRHVVASRACAALSETAERLEVDLLVLGTHGLGGFERFLVGSTAIETIRRAACHLLLVPPQAVLTRPWHAGASGLGLNTRG